MLHDNNNHRRLRGKPFVKCLALRIGLCVVLVGLRGANKRWRTSRVSPRSNPPNFSRMAAPPGTWWKGTVPRGHLRIDTHLYTGRVAERTSNPQQANPQDQNIRTTRTRNNNKSAEQEIFTRPAFVGRFPFPITREILTHGYHRYMIYCVVCHDPLGSGRGTIVERGYTQPPSYHIRRLRNVPPGHLFAVITEGYGSMPSYGDQIPPHDRWAIAAYVRALQLSQHFPKDKLTSEMQSEWNKAQAQQPEEKK